MIADSGFVIEHDPKLFSPLTLVAGRSVIGHVVDQLRLIDQNWPIVVSTQRSSDLARWCRWSGIELAERPSQIIAAEHNWKYFCKVSAHVAILPHREIYAALCLVRAGIGRVRVGGECCTLPLGAFAEFQAIDAGDTVYKLDATGAAVDPFLPALIDSEEAAATLTAAIDRTSRMPADLHIGDGCISELSPWHGLAGPLMIAEIGGNHEGDFETAVRLTELAIHSGADCVKFQLYQGSTLVSPVESPDRYRHFKKFELSREQHIHLAHMCRDADVIYLASVWDAEMLDWIDPYLDFYKVGSGDLTAWPFLAHMAKRGKPILLSSGLSTLDEVVQTVGFIRSCNSAYYQREMLCVMQCTSMYPISDEDANLRVMDTLKGLGVAIGYSDHTIGDCALLAAAAMGAEVLEFHFTDRREGQSFRDHKVSLLQDEVRALRDKIVSITASRGSMVKVPQQSELQAGHELSFRRAVYSSVNVAVGEKLLAHQLVCLRPACGTDARDFGLVAGATAAAPITAYSSLIAGRDYKESTSIL